MTNVKKNYEIAKEKYAEIDVDVEKVLNDINKVKISVNCWQGDDIEGFMSPEQELTGGISVTGNYPGKATNIEELRNDLEKVFSLIPGKHKLNLHAIYADTNEKIDLNEIEPRHYQTWVKWAKKMGLGLDFNPTFFSHANSEDGFTLSHPDNEVREFWIEHGKKSRKVAEYFGKELGQTAINNFWVPDGYKDNPIDRISPRIRLKESLDEIFSDDINPFYSKDAVESKLFGIGAEAYTVGSHEFYMGYGITRNKLISLDAGHFHPTEKISDKLSALALFNDEMLLHVSRPIRWDSDHVVIMDDELMNIAQELIRSGLLEKTHIGLDFFDASINRVAALVIGTRNTLKAILKAMLAPTEKLKKAELQGDYTYRLAMTEELKDYPFSAVWDYYCQQQGVPIGIDWYNDVKKYEQDILFER
jgi:L-rhamnose isomerase